MYKPTDSVDIHTRQGALPASRADSEAGRRLERSCGMLPASPDVLGSPFGSRGQEHEHTYDL